MSTPASDHTRRSAKPSLKRKSSDLGDELRESRRRRTDVTMAPAVQHQLLVPSQQPSSSRKRAHPDEDEEDTARSDALRAWYDRPRKLRHTTQPSPAQGEGPGLGAPSRGTKRGRNSAENDEASLDIRTPATGLHWEPEDLVGMRPAPHTPQEVLPLPQLGSGTRAGRRRSQRKRRLLASHPASPSDEEDEQEVLAILFPPPPPPSSLSQSEFGSMVPALGESSQQQAPSAPPQAPAATVTPAPPPVPLPTPSQQGAQWMVDSVEDTLARLSTKAKGQWLQDALMRVGAVSWRPRGIRSCPEEITRHIRIIFPLLVRPLSPFRSYLRSCGGTILTLKIVLSRPRSMWFLDAKDLHQLISDRFVPPVTAQPMLMNIRARSSRETVQSSTKPKIVFQPLAACLILTKTHRKSHDPLIPNSLFLHFFLTFPPSLPYPYFKLAGSAPPTVPPGPTLSLAPHQTIARRHTYLLHLLA